MKRNPIVHFEIYADDPEKLATFYSTLFDWAIEPVPGMDYRMVKTVEADAQGMATQPGINGGLMKRPAGFDARAPVNYVNVDSLDAAVKRAQDLGATVTKGRAAVPGMGWFAMLMDPQGNHFAMWEQDANAK
ncbi:MAG: VOC family protein [Acidobacteria bacterium]|nr:MAG: VOC family protein [Acidobacteriota bacterium]